MATIEQPPPMREPLPDSGESRTEAEIGPLNSTLNSLLAQAYTLNWEAIFYIGLFIVTVLTRFVNLGDRVMSHDESLHVKYSDDLYRSGNFQHTPLMHGPVLFHATALMYLMFGTSDFSARLYPAILGTIMVFFPKLLFERWLGRFGAMIGSVLLLISPMVLYHNRYIREDTPSIFFTLIMVYGIFAFIDGAKPRKLQWLIVMSVAMLLSLASKEVAFMYIGIFALAVMIFWLFQVLQSIYRGETSPIVGQVFGGILGLGALAGSSVILGLSLANVLNGAGIAMSRAVTIAIAFGVLGLLTFLFFGLIRSWLVNIGAQSNSFFKLIMAALIIGTVGALGMTVVLSIITQVSAAEDATGGLLRRQLAWTVMVALPLILVVVGTAIARFSESTLLGVIVSAVLAGIGLLFVADLPLASRMLLFPALIGTMWLLSGFVHPPNGERLPWGDIVIALSIVISAGLLSLILGLNELSLLIRMMVSGAVVLSEAALIALLSTRWHVSGLVKVPWRDVMLVLAIAALWCVLLVIIEERSRHVPNVSAEGKPEPTAFNDTWLWLAGGAGIIISALIAALRLMTNFFEEMKRYPAFDVLIVIGSLGLPWVAAFPIFLAGYPLDGSYINSDVIRACFVGSIPFWLISIVTGLCWNPRWWLACAATFYSVFAFFFTTIFTNITGIATGLIGSLGYWLAQQGVRRGGQPQYYYLLLEMPIYEYLTMIGATFAGVVGMSSLWRLRHESMNERTALSELIEADSQSEVTIEQIEQSGEDNVDLAESLDVNSEPALTQEAIATSAAIEGTFANETLSSIQDSEVLPTIEDEENLPVRTLRPVVPVELVTRLPFLPFVGFWAVLIIFSFTLAGEKMPWLTTHLTIPLAFATAWYLGTQLEKVDWHGFAKLGWSLLLLTPLLVIAVVNVVGPFLFGRSPFRGLEREALLQTFTWLGAVLLAVVVGYGIFQVWKRIGARGAGRITLLGAFLLVALITMRTAWVAAFINYDSAKEFLVYAHGAPADKTIMKEIEDISQRTTEGLDIRVAYDNGISWPGTWYFRDYPNARYLGESPETATDLDTFLAIVISDDNNAKVEAKLTDKFYKTKLIRLWWPMQDYFDLNKDRIDNVFAGDTELPDGWSLGSQLRQGLWDIWWNRDYSTYAKATNKNLDVSQWPVADWMYFYVRKDVAAQVWDFGTGSIKVSGLPEDEFNQLRCDLCQAQSTFNGSDANGVTLQHPRDLTVGPNGNLYVADAQNGRIAIFDANGKFLRSLGTPAEGDSTDQAGGIFREPWSVTVGTDGTIYVADTWNHRVQIFDGDGKFIRMWGKFEQAPPGSTGDMQGFWGPRDIAVDSLNNVYVADTGNKRIRVYDQQGLLKFDIGQSLLNEPVGLVINNETQEIFVADTWNKKIQVFGLDGAPHRAWSLQAWGPTTESGNRPYLALDKTGTRLFATDPDAGRVLVFTTDGKALLTFGKPAGILSGIAIDNANHLFVADSNSSEILIFVENQLPNLAPAAPLQPLAPETQPATEPVF